MGALFLLGDIFDYWFEYRYVTPKGYVRFLGELARISDKGIPIHLFCGNHDTWTRDFFPDELGVTVHKGNAILDVDSIRFFIGHGDGLGPGQYGYKIMKSIFNAKVSRIFYAALHPYWAYKFASGFSRQSRKADEGRRHEQHEKEKNRNLLLFIHDYLRVSAVDAFIFAHRHWPVLAEIDNSQKNQEKGIPPQPVLIRENRIQLKNRKHPEKAYYLNTGDWIRYFSFASFDGSELRLQGENLKTDFI